MVMKSHNGVDRSSDSVNGHGGSKCAVEYDEFNE